MSPPPATPPPPAHMRDPSHHLWASPQFSDYFSDAGDNATDTNGKGSPLSPIQARILGRLDAIAKKIAGGAENDGSQTPHLLDFDTELSALEARLNAPESQTREESAALFEGEDEMDAEILVEENEELRREVREGRDVIARVSKLRESLQGHYDEMKVGLDCISCKGEAHLTRSNRTASTSHRNASTSLMRRRRVCAR